MRHPQNGPTLSKAPPKKRHRMTDAELAALQSRQHGELEETKRTAAKSRRFHQRINNDPNGVLQELGPLIKEAIKKPAQ